MRAGQVEGPLDESQIEHEIPLSERPLIWGKGLSDWLTPELWKLENQKIKSADQEVQKKSMWKWKLQNQEHGPFLYKDLVQELKKLTDPTQVLIWNNSYSEWKDIYSVPSLIEELGVSRREHPRVPIMGTIQIDTPKGLIAARVISISEGGLGLNCPQKLNLGERFKATFSSPNLYIKSINCVCEVVFAGQDGYVGIRFTQIPTEAKASVIEYVKKFGDVKY
jgi:hypothetical protein